MVLKGRLLQESRVLCYVEPGADADFKMAFTCGENKVTICADMGRDHIVDYEDKNRMCLPHVMEDRISAFMPSCNSLLGIHERCKGPCESTPSS